MQRIKDGFRLLGQSCQVVRQEPLLMVVMAAGLLLQIAVFVGLFFLVFQRTPEAADFRFPRFLWLYPILLVSGLAGAVAGGTVIATAMQRLEGRDASVGEGFRLTIRRLPALFGWTLFASVVGALVNFLSEKLKIGGPIAAMLAGVTWAVVTMLVVPVLLFEGRGVFGSIKRSADLVKQRWGEGATGYGSISIALVIVMVPLMAGAGALVAVDPVLGLAAMAVTILAILFLASTLGGIFSAALYRYAAAGEACGPFTTSQLGSTFVTKEQRQDPRRRALRIAGFVLVGIYLVLKGLQVADVV